jgi:hypothetical protein
VKSAVSVLISNLLGVFLEFHQPSRFEGVKTRFTQISRSPQFNREKQNRITGWAQVAVDATIRGNPISSEEMGRYGDRLRELHASRGVLRAATPGRLNEKGRVAADKGVYS